MKLKCNFAGKKKKRMKKNLCVILFAVFSTTTFAQTIEPKTEDFKMTVKPIVTIFSNFGTGIGQGADNNSGFNLDRVYLGASFNLTESLSGRVRLDIGNPEVSGSKLERVAYVKNAELNWKTGNFTLNGGLINTIQSDVQEKQWGYRYILKSFQDEYIFGSSADMGISAQYNFTDWLYVDGIFRNGEGYKELNKDDKFCYGGGVTLQPIKPLTVRVYYDRYDKKPADTLVAKSRENLALFLGYKQKEFSFGAECNNLFNSKFTENSTLRGLSAYATVKLPKDLEVFGRWDYLYSQNDWNIAKDGQLGVVGLQYSPCKYVKLSPNFRAWQPAEGGEAKMSAFLNLQVAL